MTQPKNKRILCFCGIIACLLLSWIVKFTGPSLTEYLFDKNHFILDKLIPDSPEGTLAYFQGRMQDVVFGPVSIILSVIALLGLCFFGDP